MDVRADGEWDPTKVLDEVDENDCFDIEIIGKPDALNPDVDDTGSDKRKDYTSEEYDEYIGAEILVPTDSEHLRAVVKKRVKGLNGNPVGIKNLNPMLDAREYVVQLPDGLSDI